MKVLQNLQKFRAGIKMLYPYPGSSWHWRTELTEVPGTGMNVLTEFTEVLCRAIPGGNTQIEISRKGMNVAQNSQKFWVWAGL